MSNYRGWAYATRAETCIADGEYADAGVHFTFSAYERLGAHGQRTGIEAWSAFGFMYLLRAALCFRVAGEDERAVNRSRQAIIIAEDYRDHIYEYDMQVAMIQEMIGDFRVVGDLNGYESDYEHAQDIYISGECDSAFGWENEPISDAVTFGFLWAADNAGVDLNRRDITGDNPDDREWLAHRPTVKQGRFPEIVERLVERDELDPRTHKSRVECPACGTGYLGGMYECIECGEEFPEKLEP